MTTTVLTFVFECIHEHMSGAGMFLLEDTQDKTSSVLKLGQYNN